MIDDTNKINEGYVQNKTFEPENKKSIMIPIKVGNMFIQIPHNITDDEDYILTVCDKNIKTEYGNDYCEKFYVSKDTYSNYRLGDTFKFDPSIASIEDKHIKTKK